MSTRRDWTRESLLEGIRRGDRRALARAITLVESFDPLAYDLVRERLAGEVTPCRHGGDAKAAFAQTARCVGSAAAAWIGCGSGWSSACGTSGALEAAREST